MKAQKVLKKLIRFLLQNLEELSYVSDDIEHQFQFGEKLAYSECLEAVLAWSEAEKFCTALKIKKSFFL